MFNIGVPAFLLALEANEKKQHGRFIKVTLLKSLPAAITSFFAIAALVVFAKVFSITGFGCGSGKYVPSVLCGLPDSVENLQAEKSVQKCGDSLMHS